MSSVRVFRILGQIAKQIFAGSLPYIGHVRRRGPIGKNIREFRQIVSNYIAKFKALNEGIEQVFASFCFHLYGCWLVISSNRQVVHCNEYGRNTTLEILNQFLSICCVVRVHLFDKICESLLLTFENFFRFSKGKLYLDCCRFSVLVGVFVVKVVFRMFPCVVYINKESGNLSIKYLLRFILLSVRKFTCLFYLIQQCNYGEARDYGSGPTAQGANPIAITFTNGFFGGICCFECAGCIEHGPCDDQREGNERPNSNPVNKLHTFAHSTARLQMGVCA